MYYKKIFMDNDGFLSYFIGCPNEKVACVVDPKKEFVHEYIGVAEKFGMVITHIFDTHADMNHLNGIMELKFRTGAEIYYLRDSAGDQLNRNVAKEEDIFDFGNARLEIINSPYHDPFVNSIMLTDTCDANEPWLVLNKHSLFVVDLGWSDLEGRELADKLNDFLDSEEGAHNASVSCSEMGFNGYQDYHDDSGYAQFSVG